MRTLRDVVAAIGNFPARVRYLIPELEIPRRRAASLGSSSTSVADVSVFTVPP
jgi:hypothetical protein